MSKNPEFVKFDKVDKSYDGKVLVVKDLQLDIAEGEFITMLGPSGSGKTTCLMMLAGFETPVSPQARADLPVGRPGAVRHGLSENFTDRTRHTQASHSTR